jgi:putative transposase
VRYAFIRREKVHHRVGTLCKVLEVSEQGYYGWLKRGESVRRQIDKQLSAEIRLIYADSKHRYGSPRIYRELKNRGRRVSKKRVERLMSEEYLMAKGRRKFRVTTDSKHDKPCTSDLVRRNFKRKAPNEVWVGDITYLHTKEGWLYLAVFIDLYSRMVVGWSLGNRLSTPLVTSAFAKACARRAPKEGLIVHTDQGVQYASEPFIQALKNVNAKQSMSRKGNCWDNAVAESFFHSLKVEAIHNENIESIKDMNYVIFDYIERFYNKARRHSSLGYVAPFEFEQDFKQAC